MWNVFSSVITDIDANGQSPASGACCVMGGFLGEFLLVLSCIESWANHPDRAEEYGFIMKWDYKKYMDIMQLIFKNLIVNELDIPIGEGILDRIEELDLGVTFEDLCDPTAMQGHRRKKLARELLSSAD